jgi:hypothetical protein
MFKPKTYQDICNAMQTRAIVEIDGVEGVINTIQAEDGSGRNWNVTLSVVEYTTDYATPTHPVNVDRNVFFRE